MAGEKKYVNNQNEADLPIEIKLGEELTEAEEFTLELNGKNGAAKATPITKTVKIPANTSKVTVHGAAATDDILQWKEASAINLSSNWDKDGIITGILKNSKGEVVSEFTIEMHSTTPAAANVKTERLSTYEYNFSLDTSSKYPLDKVYYHRIQYTTGTTTAGSATAPADSATHMFGNGVAVSCENGSLSTKVNDKTMTKGFASTLYYVLEDVYGNKSASVLNTLITTDDGAKIPGEFTVTAPANLTGSTANFTWTLPTNVEETDKFTATLYYKETADSEPVIAAVDSTKTGEDLSIDFASNMKKAGFYYVEVYSNATATVAASTVKKSSEVEVKKLPSVLNPEYLEEGSTSYLKWDNSQYVDIDGLTNKLQAVTVTLVRKDGEAINSESCTVSAPTTDKTATITGLQSGVIYTAKIKLTAKTSQLEYVDSDEVETGAFFKLGSTSLASIGTTTITLQNVPEVKVNGVPATYSVNVVEITNGISGVPVEKEPYTISNLSVDEDGNLVIPGLTAGSKYRLQLKCTTSDGLEAVSGWVPSTTTANYRTFPVISGTISTATSETGIYAASTSTFKIDNVNYASSDYTAVSAEYTNVAGLLHALVEGDSVELDLNNLTAKITFNSDPDKAAARAFAAYLEKFKVVELTSGATRRELTMTANKAPEKLVLNSGLYGLAGITGAENIVCKDGADVTGSNTNKLTVEANATVTMDGIVFTPSLETKLVCTSNKLTVDMTAEENNIAITNNKNTQVEVEFNNTTRPTTTQMGKITIVNGGDVKITAAGGGSVGASMDIKVTDGNVDLSDANVSGGNKSITVETTSAASKTVSGFAKAKLPEKIESVFKTSTAVVINLSTAFDIEDDATWTNIITPSSGTTGWVKVTNDEEIKLFINYLKENFGSLLGRNATIKIDAQTSSADQGYPAVTITITENTSSSSPIVINGLR